MSRNDVISEEAPGRSFQEKSLWITTLANVVIYAIYFWRAFVLGPDNASEVGALFGTVVVMLVAVIVAGHVAIAIRHRPEKTDERDQRIALLGTRNAYYVLATGVALALGLAALSVGTFWYVHALLLAFVLGEITGSGSQLYYYRRGA